MNLVLEESPDSTEGSDQRKVRKDTVIQEGDGVRGQGYYSRAWSIGLRWKENNGGNEHSTW